MHYNPQLVDAPSDANIPLLVLAVLAILIFGIRTVRALGFGRKKKVAAD